MALRISFSVDTFCRLRRRISFCCAKVVLSFFSSATCSSSSLTWRSLRSRNARCLCRTCQYDRAILRSERCAGFLRCAVLCFATGLRRRHVLIITIARLSLLRTERFRSPIVAIVGVRDRRLMLRLRGRGLRCSVRIKVVVSVKGLELLEALLRHCQSGPVCRTEILTGGEPLPKSSPLMFEREGVGGRPRNW